MNIQDLNEKFLHAKNSQESDVNALLDFAKKAYIQNEISANSYRQLVRDLEALGAESPHEKELTSSNLE
jgi:accessory gene regulator protein AgrB